VHRAGGAFTNEVSTVTSYLSAVWGSSASDVYAVGGSGVILHSEGKATWVALGNAGVNLSSVWGSGSADVYIVGEAGTILHGP
jgi:hypothetical protein